MAYGQMYRQQRVPPSLANLARFSALYRGGGRPVVPPPVGAGQMGPGVKGLGPQIRQSFMGGAPRPWGAPVSFTAPVAAPHPGGLPSLGQNDPRYAGMSPALMQLAALAAGIAGGNSGMSSPYQQQQVF